MVRFSLFGIPIEIQPWFWITAALLGGAVNANTREGMLYTLVFMLVATVSILVHELGHALTGRRLGGGAAHIVLWAFGGLAYNRGGRFTLWQRFWMIFMGPGAGFLLLALVIGILCVIFGTVDAINLTTISAFRQIWLPPSKELLEFVNPTNPRWWLVRHLVWINAWWGLINLLPILPLDGGQIADLWVRPQPRMYLLSTISAVVMACVGVALMGSVYVAVLFGFLAYRSFQDYQSCRWR